MKQNVELFFAAMWKDYCALNPQALGVFNALKKYGETVENDHIAFRTFSHPSMNIDVLAQSLLKYDFKQKAKYRFEDKKLNARHFEHSDPNTPLIFISELDLSCMSAFVKKTVEQIAPSLTQSQTEQESFLYSGRPWPASFETYKKLAQESEYAAWVYAHGFRPNHFTVYINHLKKLNDIKDLNSFLKSNGFKLNSAGGEIKGTPQEFLEQSSTMANEIPVRFNEGSFTVPACYYEFAKRYKQADGQLFRGFIAKSADKIFESTNKL